MTRQTDMGVHLYQWQRYGELSVVYMGLVAGVWSHLRSFSYNGSCWVASSLAAGFRPWGCHGMFGWRLGVFPFLLCFPSV